MEGLPFEILVKVLDRILDDWNPESSWQERGWKKFLKCRLVSKRFKNAVDAAIESRAREAMRKYPELELESYWSEKISKYPGFTMNVVCARFQDWRDVDEFKSSWISHPVRSDCHGSKPFVDPDQVPRLTNCVVSGLCKKVFAHEPF